MFDPIDLAEEAATEQMIRPDLYEQDIDSAADDYVASQRRQTSLQQQRTFLIEYPWREGWIPSEVESLIAFIDKHLHDNPWE